MINVTARMILRAYPPSFRERYGCELETLVEDTGAGPSVVADLLIGVLQAWLRPVMPVDTVERRRRRMQASVAAAWVSWCAALYVLQLLSWVLDDLLDPDSLNWVWPLFGVARYAMYGGGLIALFGALSLLVETSKTGNWAAWRPLVALVALLSVAFGGFLLLMVAYLVDPPSYWLGALGWLGLATFLIAAAVTPAAVVTRCRPSAEVLRPLALLGVAMAFGVAGSWIAVVATLSVFIAHPGVASKTPPTLFALAAVTVAASITAVASSGRGAKAALEKAGPEEVLR
ncbi:hypothetical protein [Streptomyces sp. NPDC058964]|uniref:hypothetical protein n=1 Tax=Streptomyces sp. NPDC058964 TaxID=3346681 RepID=UPI003678E25B